MQIYAQILFDSHLCYTMKILVVIAALLGSAFVTPSVLSKNIRITNGNDAERNQFPYQIVIEFNSGATWNVMCGGAILNENWVVTSGLCMIQAPSIETLRIRAGLLNLDDDLPSVQTAEINTYVVHENFPGYVGAYDIAVLRLGSPLTFTEAVQPIALPEPFVIPSGEAVMSGWGSTSTAGIIEIPNTLQTVTVPIINLDECAAAITEILGYEGPLHFTNICTGPLFSGISSCYGDSGNPVVQDGQLIGIGSWAISPCGLAGAPSVHVRTSGFVDWINNNID